MCGALLSLLADALPVASTNPSQATFVSSLLGAIAVLGSVIVYLHRQEIAERRRSEEKLEAKDAVIAALRLAQVEAVNAASDKLISVHVLHATATAALHAARVADGAVTRDQLVHVVQQVTATLTAVGDTMNALHETTRELTSSHHSLVEAVSGSSTSSVHKSPQTPPRTK